MPSFVRLYALVGAEALTQYAIWVMQTYLSNVWGLGFTHSAAILNIWGGIQSILPLFLLFFTHAFLPNFLMILLSSVSYSLGMIFLFLSTPPILSNSTHTCKRYEPDCIGHVQKALLYTALVLLAVGMAGYLVALRPLLPSKSKNDSETNENIKEATLSQGVGLVVVVLVPLVGGIALPYIKPWSIRFGIPAICNVLVMFIFLTYLKPSWGRFEWDGGDGSPLSGVFRVFVAAAYKCCRPFPSDEQHYHKKEEDKIQWFRGTRMLRCLEKAAIFKPEEENVDNKWKLCTVQEVEEAKIAIRMIPMWMTFVVCGIISSVGNTYFVEQANHMSRKLGKIKVPLALFLLLFQIAKAVFGKLHEFMTKRFNNKEHAAPVGIMLAMVFSVLCCITAAKVELRRLNVIKTHGLFDKPDDEVVPMTIFWLFFQFVLLAGLDTFLENSVDAFYKDQAPESMPGYLSHFTKAVSGLGFMFSVLSVYVVGRISERDGKPNWFQHGVNKSRLDRYYWVLAALSAVNLVVFSVVALCYRYKKPEPRPVDDPKGGYDAYGNDGSGEDNRICNCFCC